MYIRTSLDSRFDSRRRTTTRRSTPSVWILSTPPSSAAPCAGLRARSRTPDCNRKIDSIKVRLRRRSCIVCGEAPDHHVVVRLCVSACVRLRLSDAFVSARQSIRFGIFYHSLDKHRRLLNA